MSRYIKVLRDNIIHIMGLEEYTVKEMADKCGISKGKLEDILYRKEKGLTLDTLERISNTMQIPISLLIGCDKVVNPNGGKNTAFYIMELKRKAVQRHE